jgi:hypothetical protein
MTSTPSEPVRIRSADRVLRVRYTVIGALIASSWIGARGEPVWEHALRTLLIMLTIPTMLAFARRRARRVRSNAAAAPSLTRTLLAGNGLLVAAFAASWLIGYLIDPAHASFISPIVRLALLAATLPLQVRAARRNPSMRLNAAEAGRLSFPRLLAAKFALLAAALVVDWALSRAFAQADLLVGVALFLVVARFGPRVHPHLLVRRGALRSTARSTRPRPDLPRPGPSPADEPLGIRPG